MKALVFTTMIALASFAFAAEPIATGSFKKFPHFDGFFLSVKASESISPGISFYPNIQFVLDDGTRIAGFLGCFPTGISPGKESGGDANIYSDVSVPKGRAIKFIEVMASVTDPSKPITSGEGVILARLDKNTLKLLQDQGGVLLQFPRTD